MVEHRTSSLVACYKVYPFQALSFFIVDIERIFTLLSAGHYSCRMVSPFIVIPGKRVGERAVSSKEEKTNKIYAKLKLKAIVFSTQVLLEHSGPLEYRLIRGNSGPW